MARTSRRITIDLEPGPPIDGTVTTDDTPDGRSFTGWMSLLSALAEAVEPAGATPEEVAP